MLSNEISAVVFNQRESSAFELNAVGCGFLMSLEFISYLLFVQVQISFPLSGLVAEELVTVTLSPVAAKQALGAVGVKHWSAPASPSRDVLPFHSSIQVRVFTVGRSEVSTDKFQLPLRPCSRSQGCLS